MRATVFGTARPWSAAVLSSAPPLLGVSAVDFGETSLAGLLLRIGGFVVLGGLVVLVILRYSWRDRERVRRPLPVPLDGAPPPRQIVERTWRIDDAPLPVLLPEAPRPNQAADCQVEADKPRSPEQEIPVTPPPEK